MRTRNSIDLTTTRQLCAAYSLTDLCTALKTPHVQCGTYRCPLYKPEDCGDWIRVEDKEGINLIPPEEYYSARLREQRRRRWG